MEKAIKVDVQDNAFVVDGAFVANLLDLSTADFQTLMRHGEITSVCEEGLNEHENQFRLSFFYRNRRVRLSINKLGQVLRRSVVNFGSQPYQSMGRSPKILTSAIRHSSSKS